MEAALVAFPFPTCVVAFPFLAWAVAFPFPASQMGQPCQELVGLVKPEVAIVHTYSAKKN